MQLLHSDDMEARQTAAYGVGVLAMVGGAAALGTGEVVKHVIQLAMLKSEVRTYRRAFAGNWETMPLPPLPAPPKTIRLTCPVSLLPSPCCAM